MVKDQLLRLALAAIEGMALSIPSRTVEWSGMEIRWCTGRSVNLVVRADALQENGLAPFVLHELEDDTCKSYPPLHAHDPARFPFNLWVFSFGSNASSASSSKLARKSSAA